MSHSSVHSTNIVLQSTAFAACNRSDLIPSLYAYLCSSQYTTPRAKIQLSDRLKDGLVKQTQLSGLPRVLASVGALATAEEAASTPASSFHWTDLVVTPEIRARGMDLLRRMYGGMSAEDLKGVTTNLGMHKEDLDALATGLAYGLFWSDNRVLGPVETELVVVCAVLVDGVRLAQTMHCKGIMGLGLSRDSLRTVVSVVKELVEKLGRSSEGWISIDEIVDLREQGRDLPFKG